MAENANQRQVVVHPGQVVHAASYLALERHSSQHTIKGRLAVGSNSDKLVTNSVHVAHLALYATSFTGDYKQAMTCVNKLDNVLP